MSHKISLILLLWLLLVSPQLVACAELAPYPVKDSGKLVRDYGDVIWLDNARALFGGYTGVEYASEDQNKVLQLRDEGYYVWDTEKGTVQRDTSFDGKGKICIHDEYWSYVRSGKNDDKTYVLVSGKNGEELERPFPKLHWFNPHSCRYSETKPFWIVEGHQTVPLLEEHGYLDFGTRPEPDHLTLRLEEPNPAIWFYSVEAKKSFPLPIGWLEVRILQVHYDPLSNRYLLSGLQYYDSTRGFLSDWPRDTPHKVWWLSPDGTVQPQEVPNTVSSLQGGWPQIFPFRGGLFIVSHNTRNMRDSGAAGGFIVRGQNIQKVVTGMLRRTSVSPDGCKVAVVNDANDTKPVNERTRLQIIQLCQGD